MASFPISHQIQYVDAEAAKDYLCTICQYVMKQPVQIGCNGGHLFCKSCIQRLIKTTPVVSAVKCPTCTQPFKKKSVVEIPFIQRKISDLIVKCPNFMFSSQTQTEQKPTDNNTNNSNAVLFNDILQNTQEIGTNTNTNSHTHSNNVQIGQKRQRMSMHNHNVNHTNEDEDLIIFAPLAKKQKTETYNEVLCVWNGRYGDLDRHMCHECPLALIHCRYMSVGCKAKIRRKEMDIHTDKCEYKPIECPQCKIVRVSKGFLSKHLLNDCWMAMIKCMDCSEEMQRKDMIRHTKNECSEMMIECDYTKYGCKKVKRKESERHSKECLEFHLKLVKQSHEKLEQSHNDLKTQVMGMKYQIQHLMNAKVGIPRQRRNFNPPRPIVRNVNRAASERMPRLEYSLPNPFG